MLTLLDTTLRDGSYVVDFQFTATDTALIAGALDACGVPLIEVGHGIGVRAGSLPSSRSACTDREYAEAAAGAVTGLATGLIASIGLILVSPSLMAVDPPTGHGAGWCHTVCP